MSDESAQRTFLLLSGSLREASKNNAVLRTAELLVPAGIRAVRYSALAQLPHFNPDDDVDSATLPRPVRDLRVEIAGSAALLVCTPEYAGTLPGSFKNLLDWTVGGSEISGKPVAWVNCAASGRGLGAVSALRTVLEYTGASVVDDACVHLPIVEQDVNGAGIITTAGIRSRLREVLLKLALRAGVGTES